jgi:hypothetical protein
LLNEDALQLFNDIVEEEFDLDEPPQVDESGSLPELPSTLE